MLSAIIFAFAYFASAAATAGSAAHYSVKLTPDFEHRVMRGEEQIEFEHAAGNLEWQKQPGLQVGGMKCPDGEVTSDDTSVRVRLAASGKHVTRFEYTAAAARGIRWFDGGAGFITAFYCDTWMICDNSPVQRATLRLEIVLPAASGLRTVGPGQLTKQFEDKEGVHFVFEQSAPAQTYLFSFAAAKLDVSAEGKYQLYAKSADHKAALAKTSDAYAFLRSKAGVDPINSEYGQAFLPLPTGFGQEAAGLALMSEQYLSDLEQKDDVALMAHELAHQWWGALVGVRSWSNFWLNEGMAEFMSAAYLEKHQGKAAYEQKIAENRARLSELREQGKDRPLHWEGWKDAHDALGAIPYVKGVLFLDRLRTELGPEKFWKGIALYTSRNAGRLVDSRDFQRAMEEASGRDLKALFDEAVYH